MKQIFIGVFMLVLLSACGTSNTPVATATMQPLATNTFTPPTETAIPATATGTSAPTETATPDIAAYEKIPVVTADTFKIEQVGSLPEIAMDQVAGSDGKILPEFNAWLDQLEAQGKIPNHKDPRSLVGYGLGPQRWRIWEPVSGNNGTAQRGQPGGIFAPSAADFSSHTFGDPQRDPANPGIYLRTTLNSVPSVIYTQEWYNEKGEPAGRIVYIEATKTFIKNWAAKLYPGVNNREVVPAVYQDTFDAQTYSAYDTNYYNFWWKQYVAQMRAAAADFQNPNSPHYLDLVGSGVDRFVWNPGYVGR